jgi:ATP-dependent RNA helicase DDX27
MLEALAQFTEIKIACIVGGTKNINLQAAQLRHADIVVATPGRLLDHVTNTQGVNLDAVETLVLDEADRLLDLGFQDEILELVNSCPKNRQTMLFSATFSTKVDDLIKLSLQHPVRVHVSEMPTSNNKKNKAMEVAPRLEQEFVRVRNEENREAILIALLTRTFRKSVIVFFDTKVTAHRLMIICGLLGINCSELHGNLTQPQRLQALDDFRKNTVDVLLATDVAARGIDISHVQTVINFEMPSQIENYIHRIGRTARAGKGGRSCTLIGEGRRILMKEIIKDTEAKEHKATVIRSRNIPAGVVTHFAAKIQLLESHIEEVLQAEAVARMDRIAEMEAIRAQNLIEHSDEIQARPKREWFASTQQKKLTKEAVAEKQRMIAEKVGTGVHRMTRKKRRAREAMQMENDDNDSDDEAEGNDVPASKKRNVSNIKAEVRKQKRMQAEKDKELAEKSIRDIDLEKERRSQQKKKKKASSSGDAIGDGSLFDEDRVSFAKKKVQKEKETSSTPPKSSFHFRGYDPDKKLGKRKGHKAFKSKSKFKRR